MRGKSKAGSRSWKVLLSAATVACLFLSLATGMYLLFSSTKPLPPNEEGICNAFVDSWSNSVLPKFLGGNGEAHQAARILWQCLNAHRRVNGEAFVLLIFSSLYIFLQAFAIPGPLILSIVAGALYGPWKSQLIVGVCATIGPALCYLLSRAVGGPLLQGFAKAKIDALRRQIASGAKKDGGLFWYLLFLRLSPVTPNWLVNLGSPLVGIPLRTFVLATFLGLLPANFFHCSTGHTLTKFAKGAGANGESSTNWKAFATLFALQFLAILPAVITKCRGQNVEPAKETMQNSATSREPAGSRQSTPRSARGADASITTARSPSNCSKSPRKRSSSPSSGGASARRRK
jgi:uncharacterized membrane protein YdjX (TVP38/TMEM64 family)